MNVEVHITVTKQCWPGPMFYHTRGLALKSSCSEYLAKILSIQNICAFLDFVVAQNAVAKSRWQVLKYSVGVS